MTHAPIILASQSPRRKELLETAGLEFKIQPADLDEESVTCDSGPADLVKTLARLKAVHIARNNPDAWTIGADTIVAADDIVLGKPEDKQAARDMLSMLEGRSHSVFTGYAVTCPAREILVTETVETRVWFKPLSPEEIRWYADTEEPYDKAGAYGIQGIGAFMVEKISGSYSNVVGLPLSQVIDTLNRLGVINF